MKKHKSSRWIRSIKKRKKSSGKRRVIYPRKKVGLNMASPRQSPDRRWKRRW